jgi:hypothetical protein
MIFDEEDKYGYSYSYHGFDEFSGAFRKYCEPYYDDNTFLTDYYRFAREELCDLNDSSSRWTSAEEAVIRAFYHDFIDYFKNLVRDCSAIEISEIGTTIIPGIMYSVKSADKNLSVFIDSNKHSFIVCDKDTTKTFADKEKAGTYVLKWVLENL